MGDDPTGHVAGAGSSCAALLQITLESQNDAHAAGDPDARFLSCESDMASFCDSSLLFGCFSMNPNSKIPAGSIMKSVCPVTCRACPSDAPVDEDEDGSGGNNNNNYYGSGGVTDHSGGSCKACMYGACGTYVGN